MVSTKNVCGQSVYKIMALGTTVYASWSYHQFKYFPKGIMQKLLHANQMRGEYGMRPLACSNNIQYLYIIAWM